MLNLDKKFALNSHLKIFCYNTMWGGEITLVVIISNIQDFKLELQQVSGGYLSPHLEMWQIVRAGWMS